MRRRLVPLLAVLLFFEISGTSGAWVKNFYTYDQVTSQKGLPALPAASPRYDESELVPYLGDGTSNIVGFPFVDAAGQHVPCRGTSDIYLFPATRNAQYTLLRFLHEMTAAGTNGDDVDRFDDEFPSMLTDSSPQAPHATTLREAKCEDSGKFWFTGLPAGDYVAMIFLKVETSGSSTSTKYDNGTVITSDGVGLLNTSHTTTYYSSVPNDGFLLYTVVLHTKPGMTTLIKPDGFFTATHLLAVDVRDYLKKKK